MLQEVDLKLDQPRVYTCMTIQGAKIGIPCSASNSSCCPSKDGCPPGVCPDFTLKRHDTKPPMKVGVDTCDDGAFDLTDATLAVEVSMWAKSKLKKEISNSDSFFSLANNIGFDQIMVGDIIVMERVRQPEHMLVTAFDEVNNFVQVQRGYNATPTSAWKKGNPLRIFRVMNAYGEIEIVTEDVMQIDGTVAEDQISDSFLIYEWTPNDTCLPGCFWMEFKLLKLTQSTELAMMSSNISTTPSFTPSTLSSTDFGCKIGDGVEWVRRFPSDSEGFLVKITDSPTAEL